MWYSQPATQWSHDPDKAKALLAQAGLKPADIKFTLFSISFVHLPTSEVVANQLKAFGMDVTLQTVENAVLFEKRGTGDYQAMMDGGSNPFADPDFYSLWFASDGGNFAKGVGFSDPKIDTLLLAVQAEQDVAKRRALIRQAEDEILAQAPVGFLVWRPQVEGLLTKVKNYTRVPGFGSNSPIYLQFKNVWLGQWIDVWWRDSGMMPTGCRMGERALRHRSLVPEDDGQRCADPSHGESKIWLG